jgi:flavin reductase (DIM6/NTAB) family NADH-FMN oxidoreductase RutF
VTHHLFDFAQMTPLERYKMLCGVVVPRPIALVTSLNGEGRVNAAPFSFFNVFSEDPAQIVLGLQHSAVGEPKDTTRNLAQAGEFVVNMVDEPMAETMNLCAIDFPSDVSEIEELGIATEPGVRVAVPRIAHAPFSLECRRTVSLAFSASREILIGEVLAIHARHGLTDPASLHTDPDRYRPIGRLAGAAYCRQGQVFTLRRVLYEEWSKRRRADIDP